MAGEGSATAMRDFEVIKDNVSLPREKMDKNVEAFAVCRCKSTTSRKE